MACPFKRCQDQVTHCDGACHGVMPDGSPMTDADTAELDQAEPETVNKEQGPATGA